MTTDSDAVPPIACSLSADEREFREMEFSALMDRALLARDGIDSGLLLRFREAPDVRVEVDDLVRREQACCPFFTFDVSTHGDELWLQVVAPPEGMEMLLRSILGEDSGHELPETGRFTDLSEPRK